MSATPDGPRDVVLLGSTGSIGTQALEVVAASGGLLRVVALGAGGGRTDLLVAQARATGARLVAVADPAAAARVRAKLPGVEVLDGPEALTRLAEADADVVLNAVTGSRGLGPTLAALRAGRVLALANKESLVAGGPLVTAAAAPGQVVPVDSEHSALLQCLAGLAPPAVARLVLTASGGPFRGRTAAEVADATPEEALAHPTWRMGPVVTVNSATMVNKGLEVIEAHLLFGVPYERIAVVVHPQSIVHSMVELVDGSTLLQASPPDMRLPIGVALHWPQRRPGPATACDWSAVASWTFEPLDDDAFPAVALAREAGRRGGTAPAVYNAANEEAVEAFLRGNLPFGRIVREVADVVEHHEPTAPRDADDVLAAEEWARARVRARTGRA